MTPKIKSRSVTDKASVSAVNPPMVHDVNNKKASANSASRHRLSATQRASSAANHARHHVSRHTQS